MIRKYYDVAPSIVKHINQRPDRKEIYQSIWDEYLSPCIRLIEHISWKTAGSATKTWYHTLAEKYFLS